MFKEPDAYLVIPCHIVELNLEKLNTIIEFHLTIESIKLEYDIFPSYLILQPQKTID